MDKAESQQPAGPKTTSKTVHTFWAGKLALGWESGEEEISVHYEVIDLHRAP